MLLDVVKCGFRCISRGKNGRLRVAFEKLNGLWKMDEDRPYDLKSLDFRYFLNESLCL